MEGNVTSAVGFKHLCTQPPQALWREENVLAIGVTPQCINGRMFQQDERIGNAARLARCNPFALDAQALLVTYNSRQFDLADHWAS